MQQAPRQLSLFDATMLVMGGIIGIGIFFNPADIASAVPDEKAYLCLLYTSPSPRDLSTSRMPSSA